MTIFNELSHVPLVEIILPITMQIDYHLSVLNSLITLLLESRHGLNKGSKRDVALVFTWKGWLDSRRSKIYNYVFFIYLYRFYSILLMQLL